MQSEPCHVNCAETVKADDILWKSFEKRGPLPGEAATTTRRQAPQKTNAARASHPSRIVRRPSKVAFPPLRAAGRRYRSDSTHLIGERHIYRYCCRSAIRRITFSQPCGSEAAQPSSQSGKWRRPQCPGNQYALAHVSSFPPAIHPRESPVCRQLCRNHRSASLGGPTYSVNPLCGRLLRAATKKHFALVQKLWTIRLPCGRLRKTENEFISISCRPQ
jgi:hypothetical protein